MKILLTGASGFVGAHMLKFLIDHTDSFIICPVTYKHGGHPGRIPALLGSGYEERYTVMDLDLAFDEGWESLDFADIDYVLNLASESHVDRSINNPGDFAVNNTNLMIKLLERVRSSSAVFVHMSTDEVYGSINFGDSNTEWARVHKPSNPYSATKSAQESLTIAYFKTYRIPIAIINSTNILGEAQNQEKFIPKVIKRILEGEVVNIDTNQDGVIGSRKYIDVSDVVNAIWLVTNYLALNREAVLLEDLPQKFHVSGSKEFTNLEIVHLISNHLHKPVKTHVSPSPRPGYDLRYDLTVGKIQDLGWVANPNIDVRIREITDWTIRHDEWLINDHIANSS